MSRTTGSTLMVTKVNFDTIAVHESMVSDMSQKVSPSDHFSDTDTYMWKGMASVDTIIYAMVRLTIIMVNICKVHSANSTLTPGGPNHNPWW